jgi:CrcB protein
MKDLLAIALGGGIGSACRYLVSTAINKRLGGLLAWGTMTVNLLGCLLIGFLVGLVDRSLLPKEYRLILVTGFLGGFTTFSSFALESVGMFRGKAIGAGMLNIGVNVIIGFALTIAGLALSVLIPPLEK